MDDIQTKLRLSQAIERLEQERGRLQDSLSNCPAENYEEYQRIFAAKKANDKELHKLQRRRRQQQQKQPQSRDQLGREQDQLTMTNATSTNSSAGTIVPVLSGGGDIVLGGNENRQALSQAEQLQTLAAAAAAQGIGIQVTLHNDYSTNTNTNIHGDQNVYDGNGALNEKLDEMEKNIIKEVRTVPDTIARHRQTPMSAEQKHQQREEEANRTTVPGMQDLQAALFSPPASPNALVESQAVMAASDEEFFDAKSDTSSPAATKIKNIPTIPKLETVLSTDGSTPFESKTSVNPFAGIMEIVPRYPAAFQNAEPNSMTAPTAPSLSDTNPFAGIMDAFQNAEPNSMTAPTAPSLSDTNPFAGIMDAFQNAEPNSMTAPTAPSLSDTNVSASLQTSVFYFDDKCRGSKLVMEGKGNLVVGEYDSAAKTLNVELICSERTISIPICLEQWQPPEIHDSTECELWVDVATNIPKRLFRGQREVLEGLLKAINVQEIRPVPPCFRAINVKEIRPVPHCIRLYKNDNGWKSLARGPMEHCDGSEESMKITIASNYSVCMKYSGDDDADLRIESGKARATFEGLVFQDEQKIFDGYICLVVKESESQALEVLVKNFQKGRSEWLSAQSKAPQSNDKIIDSGMKSSENDSEKRATAVQLIPRLKAPPRNDESKDKIVDSGMKSSENDSGKRATAVQLIPRLKAPPRNDESKDNLNDSGMKSSENDSGKRVTAVQLIPRLKVPPGKDESKDSGSEEFAVNDPAEVAFNHPEEHVVNDPKEDAEELVVNDPKEDAEELVVNDPKEATEELVVNNPKEATEELVVNDPKEDAEELVVNDPKEAEELAVNDPKEAPEELVVNDPKEAPEELVVNDPKEDADELAVSDPNEDAEDLAVNDPKEAEELVRIQVNHTYREVKYRGAIGYIVGQIDKRTFKIHFDDQELNDQPGGKRMRQNSFAVFGNASL